MTLTEVYYFTCREQSWIKLTWTVSQEELNNTCVVESLKTDTAEAAPAEVQQGLTLGVHLRELIAHVLKLSLGGDQILTCLQLETRHLLNDKVCFNLFKHLFNTNVC